MPRARNIKPSFFRNPDLAEIAPIGRLLFIGLWTMADREGRLEDRPRYIKFELFPGDNFDVDHALNDLQSHGFIKRYTHDGGAYIQVVNFTKHQQPHYKEVASVIPAPEGHTDSRVVGFGVSESDRQRIFDRDGRACVECGSTERLSLDHITPRSKGGTDDDDNLRTLCVSCNSAKNNRQASADVGSTSGQRRADVGSTKAQHGPLNPESPLLNPDSGNLIPDSLLPEPDAASAAEREQEEEKKPRRSKPEYPEDFETFWQAYPAGHGIKGKAYERWKQIGPDEALVAEIMAGLETWRGCERWEQGYVKSAEIWLRDAWWANEPPPRKVMPFKSNGARAEVETFNGSPIFDHRGNPTPAYFLKQAHDWEIEDAAETADRSVV